MTDKDDFTNSTRNNLGFNFDKHGDTLPRVFVKKMLETNGYLTKQSARNKEREEIICRLLASGMTDEGISLILKIHIDEIRMVESNNAKGKIPEYTRTYKARAKGRRRRALLTD